VGNEKAHRYFSIGAIGWQAMLMPSPAAWRSTALQAYCRA